MLSLSREEKCFITLNAELLSWTLLRFKFEHALENKWIDMDKYFFGLPYQMRHIFVETIVE